MDVVEKITGQKAVGYNANWLRRSPNTLKVLQELGFLYHIDDLSHDEPFITKVKEKLCSRSLIRFVTMILSILKGNTGAPSSF